MVSSLWLLFLPCQCVSVAPPLVVTGYVCCVNSFEMTNQLSRASSVKLVRFFSFFKFLFFCRCNLLEVKRLRLIIGLERLAVHL